MAEEEYYVYVVLLDAKVLKKRAFTAKSPEYENGLDCYYVGQSSYTPEKRFKNHKENKRASKYVRDYGLKLVPLLYEKYNPIASRSEAIAKEEELGTELREDGHPVYWNGTSGKSELNMSESKEETLRKMDEAGEKAAGELTSLLANLSPEERAGADKVLAWFTENFMASGYKRLGRIIKDL